MKVRMVFILLSPIILSTSCVNYNSGRLFNKAVPQYPRYYENATDQCYRVKPGDLLFIRVFSADPKTSKYFQSDFPYMITESYLQVNSYKVLPDGRINSELFNSVNVANKTTLEIEHQLSDVLNEYFKDVIIVVQLVNSKIAVLGEVKNTGVYNMSGDIMNIFHAIGMAGGITPYGNIHKISVIRKTEKGQRVSCVDLEDESILKSNDLFLKPDDILYIPTRRLRAFQNLNFPYDSFVAILSILVGFFLARKRNTLDIK